ncbi:ABC transporter permease [Arthrobacter koreensis]|uniref:ABC transporter permease n=1 Tax=Arthrobacter koreensis TaxID=199136 RepID=UPI002DBF1C66|nr:ABC transporter permease [Arthrobacter koreensis]MEB7448198.1 ABC transporter permease [Arthrobacter koreensis]
MSATMQSTPELREQISQRKKAAHRRLPVPVLVIAVILLMLLAWQALVWLQLLPTMTPGVFEVLSAIINLVVSPAFWMSLWQSVSAAFIGWVIACVLAIVVGMLIGSNSFARQSTSVLLDFGRSFPTLALIPVVILLLGTSQQMKIIMVVLACFWPVVIQTVQGSKRIDPLVIDVARTYRTPPSLMFFRVRLPSALPFIATGVRISAAMAILVAVGVEVLSQAPGLGRQITLAQQGQNWDIAFANLFFAGLFGWAVTLLLAKAERRLLRWNRLGDE